MDAPRSGPSSASAHCACGRCPRGRRDARSAVPGEEPLAQRERRAGGIPGEAAEALFARTEPWASPVALPVVRNLDAEAVRPADPQPSSAGLQHVHRCPDRRATVLPGLEEHGGCGAHHLRAKAVELLARRALHGARDHVGGALALVGGRAVKARGEHRLDTDGYAARCTRPHTCTRDPTTPTAPWHHNRRTQGFALAHSHTHTHTHTHTHAQGGSGATLWGHPKIAAPRPFKSNPESAPTLQDLPCKGSQRPDLQDSCRGGSRSRSAPGVLAGSACPDPSRIAQTAAAPGLFRMLGGPAGLRETSGEDQL
eukprot:10846731-Alexandrium_andersonii.AAC.1